jgi:proteic killer suppression protein
MHYRFKRKDLEALYLFDGPHTSYWGQTVIEKYRERVDLIASATDERDFRQLKALHFERLRGARSHQFSMRLNKQWRLILEFDRSGDPVIVDIVNIEDYH